MAKPFRGVINVDVMQSVPDWEPYTQPIAPEGTPNVLYIVLDDVGYSAMGPYGGLIETPNIDRIAERGLTKFSIAGEGLAIGKDTGEPVTADYPGQAPWRLPAARSTGLRSTSAASRSSTWLPRCAWPSCVTEFARERAG